MHQKRLKIVALSWVSVRSKELIFHKKEDLVPRDEDVKVLCGGYPI